MDAAQEARNREAFRQAVVNTLERRLFYVPSFKIYRGVAGLYDYGPPGCAVKSNVLAFWRQHFVLEENMLEVDCPCVTPEVVLKASGHVDKFTDLMVKDEKTGTYYRADHLLKDFCKEKLERDPNITAEKAAEFRHVLAVLDDLSAEELGAKIKDYGITAPDTKNPLSAPYPFNLMFQTSIGPSGLSRGYMRPETAQGIFVNFKDLYYYNGNKLPFAAAQIGQAFRNEISPRQGLLRVREFTLAEIEHFVDPEDKSHPKFSEVSNLEFLMFPREDQVSGLSARRIHIGEAVSEGIVNNETLGYFIGRVYLFLTHLGIDKERLRFRQHLANEMAHYATDCWDAEIECSYGWIECVGIADRSAYDLRAHTEKSGVPLVAAEKFSEPREVEKLVITPVKKELGLAFKGNQKMVTEALELVLSSSFPEFSGDSVVHCGVLTDMLFLGTSIGKRYARTDELGVPLAITVDSTSSVTLRERDSKQQIRVNVEEVASVVKEVTDGFSTWADMLWKYPTHSSSASED
ncbi:glycyl-tRNA synthetase [Actinidia rufa]|uniref:glycine--tRNA ligase n=1 Tax=Actinidia rufa TaxID=165716 RepID=A0A7J0H2I8_9ERIC|nr:glycyl-tRNA synthetase [Actinidia rufa]